MGTHDREAPGDDFAALFTTGTHGTGQYRCASCGYGITLHAPLPNCPMCKGETWEQAAWTPFARSLELASARGRG